MKHYNTIARLLWICPLDVLFKMRLNSNNIISPKMTYNPFWSQPKYKIKCMVEEAIIKNSNIDDLKCFVNSTCRCFDLDQTTRGTAEINSIRSDSPLDSSTRVTIFYNDEPLHKLTFNDVGPTTEFKMGPYIDTNISITDTFTINVGSTVRIHATEENYTYVCFKEYTDDCILFIGAKITVKGRIKTCKRETFALIYNKNSNYRADRFNYIMLDPAILDIYSYNLTGTVFIRDNKHCAVISNLECAVGNIYVYNINDGTMMYQTAIISPLEHNDDMYPSYSNFKTSISFIGNYLVHVKNNKYSITITWINSDFWLIEDTMTLIQPETNTLFDIKLVGIHKYLSAVMFISRKKYFYKDGAYRSMDVHYF